MQSHRINVAVIGATGKVGQATLDLLLQRGYAANQVRAISSERSAGRRLPYGDTYLEAQTLNDEIYEWADVAFISATNEISEQIGGKFAKRDVLVIDDSSVFRLSPNVPLVVPEANSEDIASHSGIISIPNCSVTPLVMLLAPLSKLSKIRAVTMTTYQAVSGAGHAATAEMFDQTRQILDKSGADSPFPQSMIKHHPKQIAFNLIPQIGKFVDNGYTSEEMKTYDETRKIMHDDNLKIATTCVRVPVETSHSGDVTIEFDEMVDPGVARDTLAQFAGVKVLDDPQNGIYPMPIDAAGEYAVLVGRIRADLVRSNGLKLWFSCDNLLKGAALNAIQILDEVLIQNKLPKK